jgi:hypothetical protein
MHQMMLASAALRFLRARISQRLVQMLSHRRQAQLIQFQKKHQGCSRELRPFLLLVLAPVVYLDAAVIHKVPESTHEPSRFKAP